MHFRMSTFSSKLSLEDEKTKCDQEKKKSKARLFYLKILIIIAVSILAIYACYKLFIEGKLRRLNDIE